MTTPVSIESIRAARTRIGDAARVTPAVASLVLEAVAGVPVFLKCEQFQRTGSFKVRGATNFVRSLPSAAIFGGLVAASAGNHAQGVAVAGAAAGASVTVVMPSRAPLAKVAACEGYGARVVLHGNSLDDARAEAEAIAAAEGRTIVPPFDSPEIIAGQGTLGLELLEQMPDLEEVIVPTGGGGLLAGIAVALKEVAPRVRVVGVQAAAMDGVARSLAAGRVARVPAARTIADGVAVTGPSELTFDLIQRYVDEVVTCPEAAITRAIVLLLERAKLVTEGAGALGAAAIMEDIYRPRGRTAVVLSGGNLDINLLGGIVRRGLVEGGRYRHLSIEVSDTPGELSLVASAIAEAGGNVLEVRHIRDAADLPVGLAILDVLVEANGPVQFEAIMSALENRGVWAMDAEPYRLATEAAARYHRGEEKRGP